MWNLPDDIIIAYLEGDEGRRLAGRLLIHRNKAYILEDYYGLLGHVPEGPVSDATVTAINGCGLPLRMVSEGAILSGQHLDVIPEKPLNDRLYLQDVSPAQISEAQSIPSKSVFYYNRAGMDSDVVLESSQDGTCLYDGNVLDPEEIKLVIQNIRSGVATIRHANNVSQLTKSLSKAEPDDPEAELNYFRQLHAANPTPEGERHLKNLTRRLFHDAMMSDASLDIGNKTARNLHLAKNPNGVVIGADSNNLKSINDTHGHKAGDDAIVAYGKALREAANRTGGIKLFRVGGDEFEAHAPSTEHAHQMVRHLRDVLDQYPLMGGTHKISMSVGIGQGAEQADKALYQAKAQKSGHSISSLPSVLAHSLHPDKPGVVATAPIKPASNPNGPPEPLPPPPEAPTPLPPPPEAPKPQAKPMNLPLKKPPVTKSEDTSLPDPVATKDDTSQTIESIKDLFEILLKKTERAPEKSRVEEIRMLSEAVVDFRRGGFKVDRKILEENGIKVVSEIDDE